MIVDRIGRRFRNLRVSLTAACNYACTYCVPDGKRLLRAREELDADELVHAVGLLIEAAGIEKLRITGGEPLVTPKFDAFLPAVLQLPLDDVSVTTNGQLLAPKVPLLAEAGLRRINVSLDTLDASRFRQLARGGDLDAVLDGIDRCLDAGIRVKLNMVPLRTGNADQVLPMLDYALDRGIELRYIELMRMGHLAHSSAFERDFLGMQDLLDLVGRRYEYVRTEAEWDSTAVRFEIPGRGCFGVIPNESEPFCSSCTRLRLSADGYLHGCLSSTSRHRIVELLALPREEALAGLRDALRDALADKQDVAFTGGATVMKLIGG
ncbi:MAG: radical SAM protein [Pseudomonadales bacterium]|jgi:cyclic pyranopterin phosphate synthase|nr:radical SAM protein [Pseudomonadales bacterium]